MGSLQRHWAARLPRADIHHLIFSTFILSVSNRSFVMLQCTGGILQQVWHITGSRMAPEPACCCHMDMPPVHPTL